MEASQKDLEQDEYVSRLLLDVARSLVDDREPVSIEVVVDNGSSTIKLCASPVAVAVLIGAKGQMARALRTILAGSSAKLGRRYALDISEARGSVSGSS